MRCPLRDRTNMGKSVEWVKPVELWVVGLVRKSTGLKSSRYVHVSLAVWRGRRERRCFHASGCLWEKRELMKVCGKTYPANLFTPSEVTRQLQNFQRLPYQIMESLQSLLHCGPNLPLQFQLLCNVVCVLSNQPPLPTHLFAAFHQPGAVAPPYPQSPDWPSFMGSKNHGCLIKMSLTTSCHNARSFLLAFGRCSGLRSQPLSPYLSLNALLIFTCVSSPVGYEAILQTYHVVYYLVSFSDLCCMVSCCPAQSLCLAIRIIGNLHHRVAFGCPTRSGAH